jgi:DNA-directed RNA polymerase III subunit RPC6
MASSSSAALETATLKNTLYDACLPSTEQDPKLVFSQASLLELGVIPNNDLNKLLLVTQKLCDDRLFNTVTSHGLGWRLRSREDAKKYYLLPPNFP